MSYRLGKSYPSMAGYLQGQGHMHYGPGTSMVQFVKPVFGMGCACGSLKCGCGENLGLGLFDSGMDFTGWGWQEWLVVGLGGYVLVSTIFTTKRAARQVREGVRKRVRRTRRRIGSKIAGEEL